MHKEIKYCIAGFKEINGIFEIIPILDVCKISSSNNDILIDHAGNQFLFKHSIIVLNESTIGDEDTVFTLKQKFIIFNGKSYPLMVGSIIYTYDGCMGMTTSFISKTDSIDEAKNVVNSAISAISIKSGDISTIPPLFHEFIDIDNQNYQSDVSFITSRYIDKTDKMIKLKIDNLKINGTSITDNVKTFVKIDDRILYNNISKIITISIPNLSYNSTYYVGVVKDDTYYYRTLPITIIPFYNADIL